MKSIFFNRYFPKFRNFARLFIASVSLSFSCSAFAQDANTAAIATDVESILQSLNWALRNPISSDPGYIPERLDDLLEYDTATYKFLTGRTSTTASINYNDKNALPYLLGSVVYGLTGWSPNSSQPLDHSLHGDLTTGNQTLAQLLALLHNISNVVAQSASTVVVSNFVSVTNSGGGVLSTDILAGNPWWATNSVFVASKSRMSQVYPVDPEEISAQYSFPEFLSMIASKLNSYGSSVTQQNLQKYWYGYWGKDSIGNWGSGTGNPGWLGGYTWFDWITDATRSNLLASATYNRDLLMMLRNLSNEVNDSSAYIANHLDTAFADSNFYLSNIVQVLTGNSPDILAGNPWWATNSGFNLDYYNLVRNGSFPSSPFGFYSFPQLMSFLSATYYQPYISDYPYDTSDFDRWGVGGADWKNGIYTFFDWLADYYKSNLVLTTSSSYSNLVSEVSQYDTSDDSNPTNVPLPEYSLPDTEIVPGSHDTLTSAEYGLMDKIESLQPNYTGGDDEIVVIPSFSVGGINVREYRARLGTSITPVCRRVASFIWYVGLFAFLFAFAKSEFVYYATLGKFWVHKG